MGSVLPAVTEKLIFLKKEVYSKAREYYVKRPLLLY